MAEAGHTAYRPEQPRNYDRTPHIDVPGALVWTGVDAWHELGGHDCVVLDAYPGTDLDAIKSAVAAELPGHRVIDVEAEAALPATVREDLLAPVLTDDRVFGVMSHFRLADFYDGDALARIAARVDASSEPVLLLGWGAALVPLERTHTLVLADLARWEIQQRFRAGMGSWQCDNAEADTLAKFKRGYFVEWRTADRHKSELFDRLDHVLDTNSATPKLITAATFLDGLDRAASRPFRVVPFFDPGVWGGQWMKDVVGLDREVEQYAWCFDCVPEENSLLLGVGDELVEIPAMDLVLRHPRELLGRRTHARVGTEFPIRFDFLDTMEGGNLSMQVHPLTEYIRDRFGMTYTQDESYYLLDADDDAVVYLGLTDDTDPEEMARALRAAQAGGADFPAEQFVNVFPARKHDHFLIPAGTVHCSGANSMVLEISSTPYIFTFKMWDWGRLGLDGKPRPIHLDHALRNVQWDRRRGWVEQNLIDQVQPVDKGDGWTEERTGLHELEPIETRRHWFTGTVEHDTHGTVNVLNLVEGAEAVVESPDGDFDPFVVHYAETFIIPASVGRYTIRPTGAGAGQQLATLKAWVRGTEIDPALPGGGSTT